MGIGGNIGDSRWRYQFLANTWWILTNHLSLLKAKNAMACFRLYSFLSATLPFIRFLDKQTTTNHGDAGQFSPRLHPDHHNGGALLAIINQ